MLSGDGRLTLWLFRFRSESRTTATFTHQSWLIAVDLFFSCFSVNWWRPFRAGALMVPPSDLQLSLPSVPGWSAWYRTCKTEPCLYDLSHATSLLRLLFGKTSVMQVCLGNSAARCKSAFKKTSHVSDSDWAATVSLRADRKTCIPVTLLDCWAGDRLTSRGSGRTNLTQNPAVWLLEQNLDEVYW